MYIGIINNSDVDRCDVFIGKDKNKMQGKLWDSYNKIRKDEEAEENLDDDEKYSKNDFLEALESPGYSAFIQCYGYHYNFELHEKEIEEE